VWQLSNDFVVVGREETMLEKLLLAMTITFPSTCFWESAYLQKIQTVSSSHLVETPNIGEAAEEKQIFAGTYCLHTLGSSELQ